MAYPTDNAGFDERNLLVDKEGIPYDSANPLPTTATISGDVNVDNTSIDTSGLIGKSSGGDFTTAYTSTTTITIGTLPSYHLTLLADDIETIRQIAIDGSVTNTYTRDDVTITVSGSIITVVGTTFISTDTFIVYTNINRVDSSGGGGSAGGGNNTYSTEQGDFTATITDSSFNIVLNVDSIGGDSIDLNNFANGILKVYDLSATEWKTIVLDKPTWTSGTKTLDVTSCSNAFSFNTGDIVSLTITGPDKSYDENLDVTKVIPQANSPKVSWSEDYSSFTPTSTTYVEGGVIDTQRDKGILLQYSKTVSTADDTLLKVVGLDDSSGTVDYQETYIESPVSGETPIVANTYLLDKAVAVQELYIPTNGKKYMRLDFSKKTDTDTDSTITCTIVHIPR